MHSNSQNMKYVFFTKLSLKRFTTHYTYLGFGTSSQSRSFGVDVSCVVNCLCESISV